MITTTIWNKEILFVTGNQNKVNEAGMYLPWFTVSKAGVDVPEIQSVDVIKVVKAKLDSAFNQTQKPCFVMDASLIVDGLCKKGWAKNFPGALIKDVFGSMGDENICELVKLNKETGCLWKSVLGYFDGNKAHYFQQSLAWDIAETPRGSNWYDWDTIFMPKGQERTFAEMTPEEKQQYALTKDLYRQFREFLNWIDHASSSQPE